MGCQVVPAEMVREPQWSEAWDFTPINPGPAGRDFSSISPTIRLMAKIQSK